MAAEAPKPPRIPAHANSMAALAATPSSTETPLAAAWATIWKRCGGALFVGPNGERFVMRAAEDQAVVHPPFDLWNADERRGAMNALLALADLAGSDAVGTIFGIAQDPAT